jgi:hypothetical protein
VTGWTWILVDIVFVAVLGCALFYGMVLSQRRGRDRLAQRATEEGTKRLYRDEAHREERGDRESA